MATEVKMPRLSLTMEVGTIIQWLKVPGDQIEKGEELAEIETDKVNVMMEAPASGYLREVLVAAGVEVPCDTTIAMLAEAADEQSAAPTAHTLPGTPLPAESSSPAQRALATSSAPAMPDTPAVGRPHVNASPAAKHLARHLGIDLSTVTGSGPGGRIGMDDVQRAAPPVTDATAVLGAGDRTVPLSKMRAAIAQRMTIAAGVPQFTVRRRVEMSKALRCRESRIAATGTGRAPGVIDLVHLAVIRALHDHPEVNASFHEADPLTRSTLTLHEGVHLGSAMALPEGLIVPVIHNAHTLSLEELAAERVRLQEDAQAGRLAASAFGGATFTISNLGTMNVDDFTAIINPPEVAILAVGRMQETLLIRDGAIHIVPMITLTVTADHRALDGAQVARFLATLADQLDGLEALT